MRFAHRVLAACSNGFQPDSIMSAHGDCNAKREDLNPNSVGASAKMTASSEP